MQRKVAIVTGASGIVGPGICENLLAAGWKVAAHSLDKQDWEVHRKISRTAFPATCQVEGDLASQEACQELIRTVRERLGSVSLVVNNAAFNPTPTPAFEDISEEYAWSMLGVNLLAPLFLVQGLLKDLKKAEGASIVNIGSIQTEVPVPGQMLYPAAKAGLEILTKIWARDLAPFQVRCNLIRVGSIPGAAFMWSALRDLPDDKARQLHEEILPTHLEKLATLNPTGKATQPNDVGELVAFLASPAAAQINGASIALDGGLSSSVQFPPMRGAPWNPSGAVSEWLQARAHVNS